MGLESGSFLDDLNTAWPLATDSRREGDDHLRLLKTLTKATVGAEHDNASGQHKFPHGNTASRPGSPVSGTLYFNTETGQVELWDGSAWVEFGASFAQSVMCENNTGSQVVSKRTWTILTIDTDLFDSDDLSDLGNNAIQLSQSGLYLLWGIAGDSTGLSDGISLRPTTGASSGSLSAVSPALPLAGFAGNAPFKNRSGVLALVNLTASDYVQLEAYVNDDDNASHTIWCAAFGVFRLRGTVS